MTSDNLTTFLQYATPKQLLTRIAGLAAKSENPRIKNFLIRYFIRKFQVNMAEAVHETPEAYSCFNDFFIRTLKPECRPISTANIVSPVDGRFSEIGTIKQGQLLQAKGHYYSVHDLLAANNALSQSFEKGSFATFYLSPQDYHRVHMPMDGILQEMIYVPGKLFSVQPATTRKIPHLFARNERVVVFFKTNVGPMAMVLVGATIVGAIGTTWQGDVTRCKHRTVFSYPGEKALYLKKAQEMGYFKLGSTVVLLFTDTAHVQWLSDYKRGDRIRLGEPLIAPE